MSEYGDDTALGGAPRRPVRKPRQTDEYNADADAVRRGAQTRVRRTESPRTQPKRRKSGDKTPGFIRFITDRRTHLALGIVFCVIAVIMVCTSVSFIMNGMEDQSEISGRTMSEIAESDSEIKTVGGIFGAKLASYLLVDTLGVASFIIAFYVFMIGLSLMRVHRCRFVSLTFKCLFSAISLSVILGLLTYDSEGLFHWGGNHGHYLNGFLLKYSDTFGAYMFSLILAGVLVAVFLNPIRHAFSTVSGWISSTKDKAGDIKRDFSAPKENVLQHDSLTDLDDTSDASEHPDNEDIDAGYPSFEYEAGTDTVSEFNVQTGIGIDSLDNNDESEEDPDAGAGTVITPQETGEGPELIITNSQPDAIGDSDDTADSVIRDGDHIGLDTPYDPCASLSNYVFPSTDILIERPNDVIINDKEQNENKELIVNALKSYKIDIAKIKATIGPTVTLYEIVPAEGVRIAKIKQLEDDIAMNLAALGIRIIAPIPGKGTIGIEVPNRHPQTVAIRTVLESKAFADCKRMALPMALGSTISNEIFVADLTKMPHLLVAGATGQGKSVGLNCIIASLLYSKHPSELKFVLVDPKMVEFSLYKRLEHHYLAKLPAEEDAIITDPSKVVTTLNSLCLEMDNRYELLSRAEVRSLEEYNRKFTQRRLNPENGHRFMPYIVMIVDEFADLIMTAGKDVSMPIARIAQKARAVGMHMIIATQRPSTDVITGMIKANFPGRIAFRVSQMVDSKTILDRPGANRLIGRGDMLFSHNGMTDRVQCAFIDTEEVENIVNHISDQPGFPTAYELPEVPVGDETGGGPVDLSRRDEKFYECARFVATQNVASTSMLQRRFQIGFNKAGRIMDDLYNLGIVGPPDGSKPRQVLMGTEEVNRILSEK